MNAPIFSFEGVTGGYGGGIVVNDVSGYVNKGEVLFVLGRNGVGKSTLLKLLFGYLHYFQMHHYNPAKNGLIRVIKLF